MGEQVDGNGDASAVDPQSAERSIAARPGVPRRLARVAATLLLVLGAAVQMGGRASADSVSNSGDITIMVGETQTITWTVVDDANEPRYCDDGGELDGTFYATDNGIVAYTDTNGVRDTVSTPYIFEPTTCTAGGAQLSLQVQGLTGGTATFGLYRANPPDNPGQNNVSSSVTVTVIPADQAPLASDTSFTTDQNIAYAGQLSATDADGDTLTYAATQPTNGSVSVDAFTGAFTYTPTAGFSGSDSFTFTASDGTLTSDPATVSITVNAVNHPPVADPASYTGPAGFPIFIPLMASDPDGQALTYDIVRQPTHGSLAPFFIPGVYIYFSDPNYAGPDSFTFTASDGQLTSAPATISITVTPGPQPPVAHADRYSANVTAPLVVDADHGVLANDTDADGSPLIAELVGAPTQGTVELNPDGSFTYIANPNARGFDHFTYQAFGNFGASKVTTVSINLLRGNPTATVVPTVRPTATATATATVPSLPTATATARPVVTPRPTSTPTIPAAPTVPVVPTTTSVPTVPPSPSATIPPPRQPRPTSTPTVVALEGRQPLRG